MSPIPALAVAALLGSRDGLRTASAFVVGEALAIGAIAVVVLVAAAGSAEESLSSALAFMELGIAALLGLLLLAHTLGTRDEPASTRVLAALDEVGPRVAFAAGLAMVAVNPKNLALALAGGAGILELEQSLGVTALAVLAFAGLAVSILTVEVIAYALSPKRGASLLARGRELTLRHERVVVSVVLGVVALLFLTRGLIDLQG